MIECNLSALLGERRIKVAELCRDTEINRGTLDRLYNDTAQRVDLDVIEILCKHLDCSLEQLFTIK